MLADITIFTFLDTLKNALKYMIVTFHSYYASIPIPCFFFLPQRSHDFRSLPRTGSVHEGFSGAVFGVVSRYVPRSRTWIADSKITEVVEWNCSKNGS